MSTTTATAIKKLRIAAIPLTRPRVLPKSFPTSSTSTASSTLSSSSTTAGPSTVRLNSLTYYQFQISTKKERKQSVSSSSKVPSTTSSASSSWFSKLKWPEEGIIPFATHKAGEMWTGFGKAEGGWKLKTYQFGEKLVDRLDFEELALKSIDPSLGPSITHLKSTGSVGAEDEKKSIKIPLIYPPSMLTSTSALEELRTYTQHRIPKHKRGFLVWMILAPFTAPFMIIPIIPNLPFFFCTWRSWSHYKAYRASEYLESLLEHGLIEPEASMGLDGVYKEAKARAQGEEEDQKPESMNTTTSTTDSTTPKHTLLLKREDVPRLLDFLHPPPSPQDDPSASANSTAKRSALATDVYRAVEQARLRVESGRDVL